VSHLGTCRRIWLNPRRSWLNSRRSWLNPRRSWLNSRRSRLTSWRPLRPIPAVSGQLPAVPADFLATPASGPGGLWSTPGGLWTDPGAPCGAPWRFRPGRSRDCGRPLATDQRCAGAGVARSLGGDAARRARRGPRTRGARRPRDGPNPGHERRPRLLDEHLAEWPDGVAMASVHRPPAPGSPDGGGVVERRPHLLEDLEAGTRHAIPGTLVPGPLKGPSKNPLLLAQHIAVVRGPVRGWGPVRGSGAWCGWCWGANGFGAGGALAPATRGPRGGLQENEVPAARLRPSLAGVRASGRALGPGRRRARHRGPVHQPDWPWVFRRRAGGRREVALRRF
jgi:hypothetical protein